MLWDQKLRLESLEVGRMDACPSASAMLCQYLVQHHWIEAFGMLYPSSLNSRGRQHLSVALMCWGLFCGVVAACTSFCHCPKVSQVISQPHVAKRLYRSVWIVVAFTLQGGEDTLWEHK